MAILIINQPPNPSRIKTLTQEYPDYIKLVADLTKQILYGGGRLHADMEQLLIKAGSSQSDIWGGGISLIDKTIDCRAVANIRLDGNKSIEILDPNINKYIDKNYLQDNNDPVLTKAKKLLMSANRLQRYLNY